MAVHKATLVSLLCVACLVQGSAACCASDSPVDASVQVGGCSGTIIAVGKQWAYGLSASHCKRGDKGPVVVLPGGRRVKAEWISTDSKLDLVLFKIPAEGVFSFVGIGPVSGDIVGRGLNGLKKLSYRSTGLIFDKRTKQEFNRSEFKVESGDFDDGDSGGGVFSKGKLCGVITHGNDDLLYAATYSQVLSFLAEQKGLKHEVSAKDSEGWGDKDRTREILELKQRLKKLETQIGTLKETPGPAGPAGPPGPAGTNGTDGVSAVISNGVDNRLAKIEAWIRNFRAVVRVRLVPKGE
jgi:hypothetical protein